MTISQLETQLQGAVNSMGVNAPLVVNEEGDCSADTANITSDYVWWNNLLQAQDALGIGAGAYYWLSSSGLGPAFSGEELLTSGYTPNTVGQDYINAYTAPPPTPTPTPSQTPTPLQTSNVPRNYFILSSGFDCLCKYDYSVQKENWRKNITSNQKLQLRNFFE